MGGIKRKSSLLFFFLEKIATKRLFFFKCVKNGHYFLYADERMFFFCYSTNFCLGGGNIHTGLNTLGEGGNIATHTGIPMLTYVWDTSSFHYFILNFSK